ncbi:MAG: hypothetical protein ABJO36_01260 [Litorimonas sp.]
MGQFSADLFLRLAKDSDNHKMLDGINYTDPEYGEGDFGDGQKQIDEFKDAVFMMLMMRAREYMNVTRQEQLCADKRHAYTSFGITLIDSDVHRDSKVSHDSFENKITGGIGLKTDTFHLDEKILTNCMRSLFTGDGTKYDPIVMLACTKSS